MNAPREGWWEFVLKIVIVLWTIATLALVVRLAHGQDVRDPLPAMRARPRVFNRPPERGGAPHALVYGVSWCSNCNGLMDELRRNAELRTRDSQGTECVRVHGTWFWLYVIDEPRWEGRARPEEVPEVCYRDARCQQIGRSVGYDPGDREAFISIVSRATNPRRDP